MGVWDCVERVFRFFLFLFLVCLVCLVCGCKVKFYDGTCLVSVSGTNWKSAIHVMFVRTRERIFRSWSLCNNERVRFYVIGNFILFVWDWLGISLFCLMDIITCYIYIIHTFPLFETTNTKRKTILLQNFCV